MGRVRVHDLGKCYKHYARPSMRLLEWATAGRRRHHVPAWVLRGVSFDVEPGEAVGVCGQNGAGKSTLLKLIKGTIQPTEGEVRIEGRLAALELGLGFHPEFTGRDNLLVAGGLLGLDSSDVRRLLPEIEGFAEIGDAIDEPVRTYSTGMQMRLAFSLATAVRPDVLLIDEALSVGDAYFTHKCIARVRQFRREGTTLLLVSHDPFSIKTLCDRALLLDGGLLVREGTPDAVLDYYNAIIAKLKADQEIRQGEGVGEGPRATRSGDGRAVIERVEIRDAEGPSRALRVGAPLVIEVHGRAAQALDDLTVGISIRDRLGNEVFGTNTFHLGLARPRLEAGRAFAAEFRLPANLGIGTYSVTVALHAGAVHVEGSYDWWDQVRVFQVLPSGGPHFVGCVHLPVEASLTTDDGEWHSVAAAS